MFATILRRAAARRPIQLVRSPEQCVGVVERLLNSGLPRVAVDCEGTRTGRFGQLSLIQLATDEDVWLVDVAAGGPGMVEPLQPFLESREVVKVFHDCREDAALLLHGHSVALAAVFDTQVGHSLTLERKGLDIYQASLAELMRTFVLGSYKAHRWDELERKPISPSRWKDRPLSPQAVRYAVEGVAHLLPLQRAMCRELGEAGEDLVIQRSAHYVEYANLNAAVFSSPDLSGLRPGAPLAAMLAARRPDGAYFKVNHGALTGAVLDATDLKDFQDLRPGDVAHCRVKSLSDCQQFVHLQRDGHGELMFDFRRREMRRLPPMSEVDKVHPPKQQHSLYAYGRTRGGSRPAIDLEPESYREQRTEVFHKRGKRGQLKARDVGIKAPKPQRQPQHRSFP